MFALRRRMPVISLCVLFVCAVLAFIALYEATDADAMGSTHRTRSFTELRREGVIAIRVYWGNCPHCGGSIRETYTEVTYAWYKVKMMQKKNANGEWVDWYEISATRQGGWVPAYEGPSWVCLNAGCGG